MKLVLALNSFGIGGTESYVLTVAEHLDRLAHEVVIYTPEGGHGEELANERGLTIASASRLPDNCDVAIVQDAAVSLELAELWPDTPQLFVCHSENFDPQAPPQLPGLVQAVVALNDRVAERLAGFALKPKVVRLRQPIDTERFHSRGPLPELPRRALVLSNNHLSDRHAMLRSACVEAGMELTHLGGAAGQSLDPLPDLAQADVVIGYGRSILEAMALGRAAYLYDWAGGNGWMTRESYPRIEANGFGGRSEPIVDADRLVDDLRRYSATMGPVNRDLISAHHRANVHVQQLVELATGLARPGDRPPAPLGEMARLVRLEWRARAEIHGLLVESAMLRSRLAELDLAKERQLMEADEAERQAQLESARELARATATYEQSLSWRLTKPLRAVGRALRRLTHR